MKLLKFLLFMHSVLPCLAQEKIQEFWRESHSNEPFFSFFLYSLELIEPQNGQMNFHFLHPL
ncbi:MAG: hypothetical protein EBX49_12245 [Synechococcaceae bacterium WB8_1B_136]|nr:hypothetical protein [Synechococcaceae bacterium WB8_1B_136]